MDKNCSEPLKGDLYYYLYGVERVGLASGYKYFGKKDWYKEGAKKLLAAQKGGKWGKADYQTAYALLFLMRGRNPVLFNKLEYSGNWNNRPRNLAALTRWMSKKFERELNWQIINLLVTVDEWHDAPILVITGNRKPKFSDDDIDKLRRFVYQGGTLLVIPECGGGAFKTEMNSVYKKMFPDYSMKHLDPDAPIYSAYFKLTRGKPRLREISNGVRALVIQSDDDISMSWQANKSVTAKDHFEIAANIAMYVAGSFQELRRRGQSHWPAASKTTAKPDVTLARLKWAGNCDPEPLAYERFKELFRKRCKVNLNVAGPIEIKSLPAAKAKIATLTGTGTLKLSAEDCATLKAFVKGGGTLVVDAAGGDKAFGDSARRILEETFDAELEPLQVDSPIYTRKGREISKVKYRRRKVKSRLSGGTTSPRLEVIQIGKRPAVIFSREDITAGLVGFSSGQIDGYAPESAYAIMQNIVLTATGK